MVIGLREDESAVVSARDLDNPMSPGGRRDSVVPLDVYGLTGRYGDDRERVIIAASPAADIDSHHIAVAGVRRLDLPAVLVPVHIVFDDVDLRAPFLSIISAFTVDEAVFHPVS